MPDLIKNQLEKRWGRIFENLFDELYLFRADNLKFILASKGALHNLGYSTKELISMTPVDIKPGLTKQQFEALLAPLRKGEQELLVVETVHQRKDGSFYDVEIRLQLASEESPPIFIAIILDITARKQAETALQESEQRYHALAKAAPVGIFRTNMEGHCLYVNECWQDIAGLTQAQALGTGWAAALHEEDRERIFSEWYQAAQAHRRFQSECRFQKPNGQVTYILTQAEAEKGTEGQIVGYVGTITDITAHKRAEVALSKVAASVSIKTGETFYQQLVENMAHLFDADYAFIGLLDESDPQRITTRAMFANGHIIDNISYMLSGTPCEHIIGQKTCVYPSAVSSLFPGDHALKTMQVESYIGIPLFDFDGHAQGLIVVMDKKSLKNLAKVQPIMEIFATRASAEIERLKAATKLANQRDMLEELVLERTAELSRSNRELESFSYSVSHDLRSPLRAIDGFSQALLEDYGELIDETGQNYLYRVRAASQRMGELIDALLTLSSVSRYSLERNPVALSQLANDVVIGLQENSPDRQVEIRIADNLHVEGDIHLLRILLENLLSNAWKYTATVKHARIEFDFREEDGETIYFVRDNGVGFDMRYADKLFGAFQRLHGTEFEGTGIGLATVQRVIHHHGGRVWAHGETGIGATFYFTL